jgi:hypothetical protein
MHVASDCLLCSCAPNYSAPLILTTGRKNLSVFFACSNKGATKAIHSYWTTIYVLVGPNSSLLNRSILEDFALNGLC